VRDIGQALIGPGLNAVTGTSVFPLTPDVLSSRTLAFADNYNLYRFRGLELEFQPGLAYTAAVVIDAIDLTDTSAASQVNVSQFAFSQVMTTSLTVPQRLMVPASAFRGHTAATWYKTNLGSTVESWDEICCTLVIAGTPGDTPTIMVRWILEFCDPGPPALLPNPLKDISVVANRPKDRNQTPNRKSFVR